MQWFANIANYDAIGYTFQLSFSFKINNYSMAENCVHSDLPRERLSTENPGRFPATPRAKGLTKLDKDHWSFGLPRQMPLWQRSKSLRACLLPLPTQVEIYRIESE